MNLQEVKITLEHFSYLLKQLPPPTPADYNARFEEDNAEYEKSKFELMEKVATLKEAYDRMLNEMVSSCRDYLSVKK